MKRGIRGIYIRELNYIMLVRIFDRKWAIVVGTIGAIYSGKVNAGVSRFAFSARPEIRENEQVRRQSDSLPYLYVTTSVALANFTFCDFKKKI